MNGVLVHGTSFYLKKILKDGTLKPQSATNAKFGNGDYEGDDIFFELVPEDIKLKSKRNQFEGGIFQFFFKPEIMEIYGQKEYKISKKRRDKIELEGKIEVPKQKVWFSTGWFYGKFKKDRSLNYDNTKSLQENIKIFHDKVANIPEKRYKTDFHSVYMQNEVVFQSKGIPLENNLLVIYMDDPDKYIKKYSEKYPQYIFTNDRKVVDKIVKIYYETLV
jgi:hypothetical protein